MNKKLLFIILSLVLTNLTFGQIRDKLIDYCNLKDYKNLYEIIDSLNVEKVRAGVTINREIVDNYYETIFFYDELFEIAEYPNAYNAYPYQINIISKSDSIIFCNFICNRNVSNPDTLIYYLDNTPFQKMKIKYEKEFNYFIDISELFDNSVVYGHNCGIVGEPPIARKKIEEYIETNNILKINKWLQSPNVELQVYACEALFRLKENGFSITNEQLDMITKIINKKGEIRFCSGCMFWNKEINYACKDFKF